MARYFVLKRIFFVFVICSLLFLNACEKKEPGKTIKKEMSEIENEVVYCNWEMSVTNNGILFPVQYQTGGVVSYFDYVQEEKYPFCSKANCDHTDSTCDAWFDSFVAVPYVYNEKIVLFSYENDADTWNFMQMEADGTKRKVLATLTPKDLKCDSLVSGPEAAWYKNGKVQVVFEEGLILEIDLETGNVHNYGKLSELLDADVSIITMYENKVLLSRDDDLEECLDEASFYKAKGESADYNAYYKEWYNTKHREIYSVYDLTTGKNIDLFDVIGLGVEWDYSRISDSGEFYYTHGKNIGKINLENASCEIVYTDDEFLTMECVADGKVLFLSLDDKKNNRTGNYYMDLKTGEVIDLSGDIAGLGWVMRSSSEYFVGYGDADASTGIIYIPKESFWDSKFRDAKLVQAIG